MERLTEHCGDLVQIKKSCNLYDGSIVQRLAAYEDTGFDPMDIEMLRRAHDATKQNLETAKRVIAEWDAIILSKGYDFIKNLLQAEQEGRLVVLPCKVGDMVWLIEDPWTGKPLKKPLECEVNAIKKYSHGVYINLLFDTRTFNGTRDFNIEYFGKSVFLAREEAEAALKGESNG